MNKCSAIRVTLLIVTLTVLLLVKPPVVGTFTSEVEINEVAELSINGTSPDTVVSLIIETRTNNYAALIDYIKKINGTVHYAYKYINALSVSIPASALPYLANAPNVASIRKDTLIELMNMPEIDGQELDNLMTDPLVMEAADYEVLPISVNEIVNFEPNTYWNPEITQATSLWEMGYYGNGSLAVIIDTGIWTGHFMFWNTSFLGGIDLSFDNHTICDMFGYYPPWYCNETFLGWDNPYNHWHGSHVAGILAGFGAITLPENHPLVQAIERYTGTELPSFNGGMKVVLLTGMAPLTQLYIIKVFDHTGRGAPQALVMMAIEHAIDLKLKRGYDVDLISMSLGGPTLYDGRDAMSKLVDYATSVGITVVAAAGNDGPAMMTVSSPGSAYTAITVGAAADPVHTRVFWDYYYGYPGIGEYLYRTDNTQIIYFSSRGPTSDGRSKPTISATGVFVLSAYPTGGTQALAFASGTSMSTPAVSGGIALLNSYAEANWGEDVATPEDYRQALTAGAVWLPGYEEYDQGAGYLNVAASLEALKADPLGDVAPSLPVSGSLEDITNIPIVGTGEYKASIENLAPGHKVNFNFWVTREVGEVILLVHAVFLGNENPLGINSFEIYIQGAKRTYFDYFIYSANVFGGSWFEVTDDRSWWGGRAYWVYSLSHVIEPGIWRIVIENDWTSYDLVSCNITIKVNPRLELTPSIIFMKSGNVREGEGTGWIEVPVPLGTYAADIRLYWTSDWSVYPTNDLDMYIYWDEGFNFRGATLNCPERVVLVKPSFIYVYIYGYAIYNECEEFTLIISFTMPRWPYIQPA